MTETETEVIEKKKKNKFKKIVELEEPAIKKFIIDERNSGKTWAQVVSKLKIEKNVEACGLTLQKVYEKALATSITRSPIARDQFKSMYNTVNERYEKACFSMDTQILTNEGWKYYGQLKDDEIVMTYNSDAKKLELQKISDKFKRIHKGVMFEINSARIDLLITPDHRIVYKYLTRNKYLTKTKEVKDIKNTNLKIPCAAKWQEGKGSSWTDDKIKLCAWIITEGHFKNSLKKHPFDGITIVQCLYPKIQKNHLEYAQEIDHCLINLKINYTSFIENKKIKRWIIPAIEGKKIMKELSNKQIPRNFLNEANYSQLLLMFKTLIKGDGSHYTAKGRDYYTYSSKDKNLIDQVQELSLKLGFKTAAKKIEKSNCWFISCIKRDFECITLKKHIKQVYYPKMLVWDVSVPNSYIVVRRNGKVCITGNCKWIDRLGEIFDNLYEKVKKGEISELILLKIAPIIQNNSKEVLNQLKFIRDEQERITVQQKNLIYSPIQIIQVIHNNLKKLQEEGFITIHKPIQEIKIEDDEVKEEDKESD